MNARQAPSILEWWAVAALALSAAFVVALIQPAVGRPAPGGPTFVALSLAILGSALQAAAVARRLLTRLPGWVRGASALGAFGAAVAGGVWVLGRAPGSEVLLAWMVAPAALGIAALIVAGHRGSWTAVGFLVASGAIIAAVGPRWLERQ